MVERIPPHTPTYPTHREPAESTDQTKQQSSSMAQPNNQAFSQQIRLTPDVKPPQMDTTRIEALKSAIADNSYSIDVNQLADKLLTEYMRTNK